MITSVEIAKVFKKNHEHVVTEIEKIIKNKVLDFAKFNFRKSGDCYEVTKNGLMLLVMGFTDKRAMKFKISYIKAFDQMESTVRPPGADKPKYLKKFEKFMEDFFPENSGESLTFSVSDDNLKLIKGDSQEL